MDSMHLKLVPIDRQNWRATLEVSATPEQMRFVADYEPVALVILAKSFVRPQKRAWLPFAFEREGLVIGVCALAMDEDSCELFHFLIDKSVQRRGYGREALCQLIDYVRHAGPVTGDLVLTVHRDNEAAQSLYRSVGFERTDKIRDGEEVWRLVQRS